VLKSECKAHVQKQAILIKGYYETKSRLEKENTILTKALDSISEICIRMDNESEADNNV